MKGSSTWRHERLQDLIMEEVSRLLLLEVKDPRIGMITVTGAVLSPDKKRLRVYYNTGMGCDDFTIMETQKGLSSASGFVRSSLASKLSLKRTPEIIFEYDKTLDYGEKIDKILSNLKDES